MIVNERNNNLMATTTMRPQIITNVRVSPIAQQHLSRTKVDSSAHYQSRNVQNINNASTYVPPPPESFLIPNSTTKVN